MQAVPTPPTGLFLKAMLLAGLLFGASQAGATNIRVLIASGAAVSVRVPMSASLAQNSAAQNGTAQGASGGVYDWSVTVNGSALSLNGQPYPGDTLYLPPVPGSSVQIGGRTYRGGVLLKAARGVVNAVNVADLEDYLRGVVPAEMPSSWPLEALKSQAVVARTYAASHINPASYYDLCATDACQVYGGVSRETAQSDAAVAATRAQVVSYAGAAAKTYFSSDSGGYTASSLEAWGQDLPYLTARPDPASPGPNSRWTLTLPLAEVGAVASRYGVRVGQIRSLNIVGVSPSGRATAIVVSGASGSKTLQGADAGGFVRSLGARSSRINFSGSDPLIITGAGAGHGVGLSQWGASGWAQVGWNYLQIMGFYYVGASISSILGADLPGGRLSVGLAFNRATAPVLPAAAPVPVAPLLAAVPTLLGL
ncbi:SpoIID/LytB domain-containing protein [Deinococcus sp.]|uniref:SpoIID/LytB domain-containing protein n=1 Tax=Deinococcus sp. TaxID=47478 RepID=UPI003C7C65F1